jgi:hypothetical protein
MPEQMENGILVMHEIFHIVIVFVVALEAC